MLLSSGEKARCKSDVGELIVAGGVTARIERLVPGESLYGDDEGEYQDIGDAAIEMRYTPAEKLGDNIDATTCVLPESEIKAQDRLVVGGEAFRVQTVKPHNLFGAVTHFELELVRVHGR